MGDTRVVCVKVTNIRPKYNNLDEWMKDQCNVYIGRAGVIFINGERFPKKASPFANPFKINKKLPNQIEERNRVLEEYRKWILNNPDLLSQLGKLEHKTLGCWCYPEKCHGDILVELIASTKLARN